MFHGSQSKKELAAAAAAKKAGVEEKTVTLKLRCGSETAGAKLRITDTFEVRRHNSCPTADLRLYTQVCIIVADTVNRLLGRQKLIQHVADMQEADPSKVRLVFDGEPIPPPATPKDYDMEDDDLVDVNILS